LEIVCHRGGRHGGSRAGDEAEVVDRVIEEVVRGERRDVENVRGGGAQDGGLEGEAVQHEEAVETARAEQRHKDDDAGERGGQQLEWKARRDYANVGSGSARWTAWGAAHAWLGHGEAVAEVASMCTSKKSNEIVVV
jgi:hypothetical protein